MAKTKETTNVENTEELKEISPAEYFELVKSKMEEEKEENVRKIYDVTLNKMKKYMISGQVKAAKELYAKALYLEKELELLRKGVSQYVLRTDVSNYIENIANDCVCIIELKNYDREIPDDILDIITDTKDLFDEYFVVFTDYTGEVRSKVEAEKRDKDPILFGNIFIDGMVSPKMYFLGDWIDEFCDLTLDKMIEEIVKKEKKKPEDILYNIDDYSTLDSIEQELFGTAKRMKSRSFKDGKVEVTKKTTRRTTTKKSSAKKTKDESEPKKTTTRRGRKKKED